MTNKIVLIAFCLLCAIVTNAQKWEDLSDEQKLSKLRTFRAGNQKYLKDSLRLTPTQIADLDNLNLCFLSTLDRIDRYAKDQQAKDEYAEALWEVRWAQVDAIMGKEKHDKYASYIKRQVALAVEKKQL
jgi:hypothetical protein